MNAMPERVVCDGRVYYEPGVGNHPINKYLGRWNAQNSAWTRTTGYQPFAWNWPLERRR